MSTEFDEQWSKERAAEREQVYVVRLTEEERQLILYTHPARGTGRPLGLIYEQLTEKLESARPEHPERQVALEELAVKAAHWRDSMIYADCGQPEDSELMEAMDRLRSLEGK